MNTDLSGEMKTSMRIPYALRRVPRAEFSRLLPWSDAPQPGDIGLARVERIGRNAALELSNGRRCSLHEGDPLAVVFGNRYATLQFEGYARANGERCDLLSMAGLCGVVESKHAEAGEPTKLHLLGFMGDAEGSRLRLRRFALPPASETAGSIVRVIVVCGTSMDSGKTHTAMSLIVGLRRQGYRVAAVKLTGTASGRDAWKMLDAGACVAVDFVDGGLPSTYLCELDELLNLHNLFLGYAASQKAACMVVEIADGLLQNETAALLQSSRFTRTVDAWIFAAGDPLAAAGGVRVLRSWRIKPLAISGAVSMSPLGIKEAQIATGLPCLTARELQNGKLNAQILDSAQVFEAPASPASAIGAVDEDLYQHAE